jgi:hypothetical protein
LQIVANFADRELPMPALVAGESLWRLGAADAPALLPNDIIVRLGQERDGTARNASESFPLAEQIPGAAP